MWPRSRERLRARYRDFEDGDSTPTSILKVVLANAQHVRNVPGRKSDVSDAMWLSDLLAHGLIRGSFVPPTPVQEMRDLTRTRKQLVREIAQHTQRIQKVLEDANIKLDSVISNILGTSGRAFLAALIDGESDPEKLADLAHPRPKVGRRQLVEALRGRVTQHHQVERLKTIPGVSDTVAQVIASEIGWI